jgi:LysR family transcriptional regulator, hydrogen peroxide-inducible genes activator
MTLTQFEYVLALNTFRHFGEAAEHCNVTQPTLSAQIQKLEEQIGIKLFDRSKQPVVPTQQGEALIQQMKQVLHQKQALEELIQSQKGIINGTLRLGIIPTLAPYLLPLFVNAFIQKYDGIKFYVTEHTTEQLVSELLEGKLDAGILVTPLQEPSIKEQPLFYEKLVAYVAENNPLYNAKTVQPEDIATDKLWLLEEGHCFRSQMMQLCKARNTAKDKAHFHYEAGSLETLRKMVDMSSGITILPQLATTDLSTQKLQQIKHFPAPEPVREVSIITHRDFVKKRLVDILRKEILLHLPKTVQREKPSHLLPILQ